MRILFVRGQDMVGQQKMLPWTSILGFEARHVSDVFALFDLFKIYPDWSGMVPGPSQTL